MHAKRYSLLCLERIAAVADSYSAKTVRVGVGDELWTFRTVGYSHHHWTIRNICAVYFWSSAAARSSFLEMEIS